MVLSGVGRARLKRGSYKDLRQSTGAGSARILQRPIDVGNSVLELVRGVRALFLQAGSGQMGTRESSGYGGGG